MNKKLAEFDSKCKKHWIIMKRMCISNWTPRGTSVRVEDMNKTALVMPQTVTDAEAMERMYAEVMQPLLDKGIEFEN